MIFWNTFKAPGEGKTIHWITPPPLPSPPPTPQNVPTVENSPPMTYVHPDLSPPPLDTKITVHHV